MLAPEPILHFIDGGGELVKNIVPDSVRCTGGQGSS